MFSAALEYMKSESCPVVALSRASKSLDEVQKASNEDGLAIQAPNQILHSIILENKILHRREIK